MIGQTISHYLILDKLGEGGMGVVYRARDTQLDRNVALKFLPSSALSDEEMRARFMREAKAAAQLNHPNIATVHGIGEIPTGVGTGAEEGQAYIAMELVEGETLSNRIKKGPMKLEDVVQIGCQVADGLQAAHDKGIVHRDIKSSNVMLVPTAVGTGWAKIMDFGLAMTAASTRLTKTSSTLGTASYMSPEQARGEMVDKRTDIWSLGVMLYEMIAGQLPFKGDYEQAAVYGILHEEPEPLTAIRTGVPMELERVVMKCLVKDREKRYQHVEEVRVDLAGITARPELQETRVASSTHLTRTSVINRPWKAAMWALFLVLCGGLVGWLAKRVPENTNSRVVHAEITLPSGMHLDPHQGPLALDRSAIALSPDGQFLAYVAADGNSSDLVFRDLTSSVEKILPGTSGAYNPFFSPDGNWIGFYSGKRLKKIEVTGSNPVEICEVSNPYDAVWGRNGQIVFVNNEGGKLAVVLAGGGTPIPISVQDAQVPTQSIQFFESVSFLPDETRLLVTGPSASNPLNSAIVDLETGSQRSLGIPARSLEYLPTGHLLIGRNGRLEIVAFDLADFTTTGSPRQVVDDVYTGVNHQYALSREGTLIYATGPFSGRRRFMWIDREGRSEPAGLPTDEYWTFTLSPDGSRLATEVIGPERSTIAIFDLAGGPTSRLSSDGNQRGPLWAPGGKAVIYGRVQDDSWLTASETIDGIPELKTILTSRQSTLPAWITPDGAYLGIGVYSSAAPADLMMVALNRGDSLITLAADGRFAETLSSLSPDGTLVAYTSDLSGQYEVYVQPIFGSNERIRVSSEGGEEPIWSSDGSRLFYRYGNKIFETTIFREPELKTSPPELVFERPFLNIPGFSYDVSVDDERFLVLMPSEERREIVHLDIVLGWFTELERLVPTDN